MEGVGAVVVRRRVKFGSPGCPGTARRTPVRGGGPCRASPLSHLAGTQRPPPQSRFLPGPRPPAAAPASPPAGTPNPTSAPAPGSATRKQRRRKRRTRPRLSGPQEPIGARGRRARALPAAHALTPLASSRLFRPHASSFLCLSCETSSPPTRVTGGPVAHTNKGPVSWPVTGCGEGSRKSGMGARALALKRV